MRKEVRLFSIGLYRSRNCHLIKEEIVKVVVKMSEEKKKRNENFWRWFAEHAEEFYETVNEQENIPKDFISLVSNKLGNLRNGFFILAGMYDDDTAELIITADGNVSIIPFIEELVASAPSIPNWKFTALKPPTNRDDFEVGFSHASLSADNLFFTYKNHSAYPDLIDIDVVHADITDATKRVFTQGIFIFLENYIGEMECIDLIDSIDIKAKHKAKGDLVPMSMLASFLKWRHKELVEKYDQVIESTDDDIYTGYESKTIDGNTVIATINTKLLNWEHIAAYPWITVLTLNYENGNYGMPSELDYQLLDDLEERVNDLMTKSQYCLNLGRETGEDRREILYATKDFRQAVKVMDEVIGFDSPFKISYDVFKDKYWRSLERFRGSE